MPQLTPLCLWPPTVPQLRLGLSHPRYYSGQTPILFSSEMRALTALTVIAVLLQVLQVPVFWENGTEEKQLHKLRSDHLQNYRTARSSGILRCLYRISMYATTCLKIARGAYIFLTSFRLRPRKLPKCAPGKSLDSSGCNFRPQTWFARPYDPRRRLSLRSFPATSRETRFP